MLQTLQNLTDNWLGWLGLGATAATLLSFIPGFGVGITLILSGLRIVASLLEAVSPIINALLSGLLYLWENVIWPGLVNIFHSLATLLTVIFLMGGMYLYLDTKYKVETHNIKKDVKSVKDAYKNNKPIEDTQPEVFDASKILPWNW